MKIYNWTVKLICYLKQFRKNDRLVWSIIDQLIRSGSSVGANYVEAIGAPTVKDFRKFLAYSLKSCNESTYWLAIIRDSKIDSGLELNKLLQEAVEISHILGKSVSTMYKKDRF